MHIIHLLGQSNLPFLPYIDALIDETGNVLVVSKIAADGNK